MYVGIAVKQFIEVKLKTNKFKGQGFYFSVLLFLQNALKTSPYVFYYAPRPGLAI